MKLPTLLANAAMALLILGLGGCRSFNTYEATSPAQAGFYKEVALPLLPGTHFRVRQGAFGLSSHNEPGNQYNWDLEVPLDSPVAAAEAGRVVGVFQPAGARGGANPAYANLAWNVQIEHADGSVAQYVHVAATVAWGEEVSRGQVIGRTVWLGWISYPHVHFGIYQSRHQLYHSAQRQTLPLRFRGIPGGLLIQGREYLTPGPE